MSDHDDRQAVLKILRSAIAYMESEPAPKDLNERVPGSYVQVIVDEVTGEVLRVELGVLRFTDED